MNFASTAVWLTALTVAASAATLKGFNVTSLPNEKRFFFENKGNIKYQTSTQPINFVVPLASYANSVNYVNDVREQAKSMCNDLRNLNVSNPKEKCEDFRQSLENSYSSFETKREFFARAKKFLLRDQTRRKRGASDVALDMFGLSSNSEVKRITDAMNGRLEKNGKTTDELAKSLESVLEHMSDADLVADENTVKLNYTFRRLGEWFRRSTDARVDGMLDTFKIDFRELVAELKDCAEALTRAAEDPRNTLLRWANLTEIGARLARIDPEVNEKLLVDPSAESEVGWRLRKIVDVRISFCGEQLQFELDVPLVFRDPFVLYKLHAVPKSVRSPNGTTARVVELRPADGKLYLGVTANRQRYVGLTAEQMGECKQRQGNASLLCNAKSDIERDTGVRKPTDVTHWSCGYAQFMNVANSTGCKEFEVDSFSKFVGLNSNVVLYWVDRPTGLNVTCQCDPDRTATERLHHVLDGVGLLSLADCCSADSESGVTLNAKKTKNAMSYGINLPFPNSSTVLNVSSTYSKIQSIAGKQFTSPNLEQNPTTLAEIKNSLRDVIIMNRKNGEENEPIELASFAKNWHWYAAAAVIAFLLVHFTVKCARKKLFKCCLGRSNAKKLKLLQKVTPPANL